MDPFDHGFGKNIIQVPSSDGGFAFNHGQNKDNGLIQNDNDPYTFIHDKSIAWLSSLQIPVQLYDWFYSEWFGPTGWFGGGISNVEEFGFQSQVGIVWNSSDDGNYKFDKQASTVISLESSGDYHFGKP